MRYISIIIIAFLLTSCCATKKVAKNTPKKTQEVQEVTTVDEIEVKDETPKENNVVIEDNKVEDIEESKPEEVTPKLPPPPKPPKETENYKFNHNRWNTILEQYVTEAGNVDYQKIRADKELDIYIDALSQNMPTDAWTKQEKLAYWINTYNALTIDLILRHYPVKSIKDIKDPWKQRYWKLGEKWYNLDEIEHQILRKMDEPRIHFAIVCASFSCPKLQNKAFTAENMETQLTKATTDFLTDSNRNNISQNNLKLSKIFKWFSKDFKQNGSLIDFLNTYSQTTISNKAKISYKDYNWDLND